MEESKRQKQVAKAIQEELTLIFQKENLSIIQGGMVSIAKVMVTPDLLEARIYLSFFKIEDPKVLLELFKEKTAEFRGLLGNKMRHQLRRIPELQFFLDDTLDHVFRMEELFKQINTSKSDDKGDND
jgi:ribosome-binding factor A